MTRQMKKIWGNGEYNPASDFLFQNCSTKNKMVESFDNLMQKFDVPRDRLQQLEAVAAQTIAGVKCLRFTLLFQDIARLGGVP